jgi:predicted RNA binding protein YcfA (HicA-like mRNA interferase family)
MKVRDAIKLIEKDGWRLKRTRGDHRVYTHPQKNGIVVVPGIPVPISRPERFRVS